MARTIRETIESIIVAFVLAFLFRTFEAEAFVIPTGSMAPTLQGRHKDLVCPECGLGYRVGASSEVDDDVQEAVPKCETIRDSTTKRATGRVDRVDSRQRSGRGDLPQLPLSDVRPTRKAPKAASGRPITATGFWWRSFPTILPSPKRWDVVVFRFPGNGQMNYIKRLVGLPRETVKIEQGDIYVKPADDEQFEIVHKPAAKVWAMAQAVYNNDYVVDAMTAAGWPLRWQPMGSAEADGWASTDGGRSYETAGGEEESWIRYQHFTPNDRDWQRNGASWARHAPPLPHLITDFYAYNTGEQRAVARPTAPPWDCTGSAI